MHSVEAIIILVPGIGVNLLVVVCVGTVWCRWCRCN